MATIQATSAAANSAQTQAQAQAQAQETVLDNKYRIEGVLSCGGFGTICLGTDLQDNKIVAIKLERRNNPITHSPPRSQLRNETSHYNLFRQDIPGIPKVFSYGRTRSFRYLVTELFGASLQELFCRCKRKFSLKTILMLADQLLSRMEAVHSNGLIHCDVKPENFAMGRGKEKGKIVHVLDFGMSITNIPRDQLDEEQMEGHGFFGTMRFASTSAHLGIYQAPKDDLESVAYMLIYFARGNLPWQGLSSREPSSNGGKAKDIGIQKLSTPIDDLCLNLPPEFAHHLMYARALKYEDKPNYTKLRRMYARLLEKSGWVNDSLFDWDVEAQAGSSRKRTAAEVVEDDEDGGDAEDNPQPLPKRRRGRPAKKTGKGKAPVRRANNGP